MANDLCARGADCGEYVMTDWTVIEIEGAPVEAAGAESIGAAT